jgi:hypothetical protein
VVATTKNQAVRGPVKRPDLEWFAGVLVDSHASTASDSRRCGELVARLLPMGSPLATVIRANSPQRAGEDANRGRQVDQPRRRRSRYCWARSCSAPCSCRRCRRGAGRSRGSSTACSRSTPSTSVRAGRRVAGALLHLAIGTIVVAPMIIVGLFVRKWLVTGLTLGAVTGD